MGHEKETMWAGYVECFWSGVVQHVAGIIACMKGMLLLLYGSSWSLMVLHFAAWMGSRAENVGADTLKIDWAMHSCSIFFHPNRK